jgi:adenylate cyclase
MLPTLRPTLKQVFFLSLAGLALSLAILLSLFVEGSQSTILQSSERFRDSASREVADRVRTYLGEAPAAVSQFEDKVRYGLINPRDRKSIDDALLSLLLVNRNVSETSFTFGKSRGFDGSGILQLDPMSTGQITLMRAEKDEVDSVMVWFDGTRFLSEPKRIDPRNQAGPGPRTPVSDPTRTLTFSTPSAKNNYGDLMWTDLHWANSDVPEAERRVEVSVLKAVDDAHADFAGVLRVSLTTAQLDRAMKVQLAEAGKSDPHMIFLCDRQGRLITGFGNQKSKLDGEDLRFPADNAPEEVKAALRRPELKSVDQDNPSAVAMVTAAGSTYLCTFRAMPEGQTQDWIVGIVVPRSYYLDPLLRIQRRMFWITLALMIVILLAGSLILSMILRAHSMILRETGRMKSFDFTPAVNSSPLGDVEEVLQGLEKAKTAMRAMGKYVPVDLVRRLYHDGKEPVLGAEQTELSVLFTDIREFTPVAESSAPDQLAATLGRYLQLMAGVIQEEKGTVDKYMGDAVMAFWNAPAPVSSHTVYACRAALRCRDELEKLFASPEWAGRARFETRFGLHVCVASVGHFGAPDRFNYTAIGDGINLASRLEGLNKFYGTTIIVTEDVKNAAGDEFEFRRLDRVSVKGKTEGITIYELMGVKRPGAERPPHVERYEAALAAYQQGEFKTALTILGGETEDTPSVNLKQRCREYIENPPGDWQGIRVFHMK